MADFETAANAVVSELQTIEQIANSAGEQFLQLAPQLEAAAAKSKQQNQEIDEALTALDQRVDTVREAAFGRIDSVKQKLAKMFYAINEHAESIAGEMSKREDRVITLDDELEKLNGEIEDIGDSVIPEIDDAQNKITESNAAMKETFDDFETQLEKAQTVVDRIKNELTRELKETDDVFDDQATKAIQDYSKDATEALWEMLDQWGDKVKESSDLLREDLATAAERIQQAETEARVQANSMVEELDEVLEGESVQTATEKVAESAHGMNDRMQQSRSRFDVAVDGLRRVIQVMTNMVNR